MTLYGIQTFPVSVPGNDNLAHVTEIKNLPYGIAFRSTDPEYEYLTFQNVQTFTDHFYYFRCLEYFQNTTPASALLSNNQRQTVNELCHITGIFGDLTISLLEAK